MIGSAAMSCAYVASGQFGQYKKKEYFVGIAAGLSIIKQLEEIIIFYPEDHSR